DQEVGEGTGGVGERERGRCRNTADARCHAVTAGETVGRERRGGGDAAAIGRRSRGGRGVGERARSAARRRGERHAGTRNEVVELVPHRGGHGGGEGGVDRGALRGAGGGGDAAGGAGGVGQREAGRCHHSARGGSHAIAASDGVRRK